jgi:hypothetical protein
LLTVYSSPGRCSSVAPGTQAPSAGQKVEVAWVDRFGRMSPHSAPVEATEASSAVTDGL